jgi:hypothetical protein
MAYEPYSAGDITTNVFAEAHYKLRCTFGASSAVTYRSKDASIAKTTTTQFTVTLPKYYAEVTDFSYGWEGATSTSEPALKIVTNSVATDGTLVLESHVAGTPTAPNSGAKAYITIGVSSDVLNDKFVG